MILMTKFLLKVIGITLVGLLVAIGLVFTVLYVFTPKTLAEMCDGVGIYDGAVEFMYKQYGTTDNIKDLDTTCRYAIKGSDDKMMASYLGKLVEREDFLDYCKQNEGLSVDYYDFICGKYVASAYKTGADLDGVLSRADNLTVVYGTGCALRSLAVAVIENGDRSAAEKVSAALIKRAENAVGAEKELIENDKELFDDFLSAR